VGRVRELVALSQDIQATRLLSLLGPAGVGKTRLAMKLAATVRRRFRDGVWLVELAPHAGEGLLPSIIARAFPMSETVRGDNIAALEAALASREMLLVLDGCELVVDQVADAVDRLLHGCPTLKVLATSRDRLGLDAELVRRVPPLEVPRAQQTYRSAELASLESVALFVDRAQRVNPAFAIVEQNVGSIGELMRRLDGLPLAVELAATWMDVASPNELVEELDDRYQILVGRRAATERQTSLWAAVESGYGRLDPAAQRLFRQLGVFAGGWNLGAMTAVCRLDSGSALEVLGRLADHSMVTVIPTWEGPTTRYRLLEVLRRFSMDRLEASGELDDVRERFVDHFVSLAETASPNLAGREGPCWLATLDAEVDNVRAVFATEDSVDRRLRLAAALVPYWQFRGLVGEGRLRLGELVAAMNPASPGAVDALVGLSALSWAQGDVAIAARHARAAFRVARLAGDRRGAARALLRLAQAQFDSARPALAGRTTGRAEQVATEFGDRGLLAECSLRLAQVALVESRPQDAESLLLASVRLSALEDQVEREAVALLMLGRTYLQQGRPGDSEEALRRSLTIAREFALVRYGIPAMESMAAVAAASREYGRAATLVGAAEGLLERVGARPPRTAPMRRALEAIWLPALNLPGAERDRATGHAMDLQAAIAYALRESSPPVAPSRRSPRSARELLTPQQRRVASLIGRGMSNREIAGALGISERTAEGHAEKIYDRLGFNRRSQLVDWVRQQDGDT
jgi:predicted ATPase/DNA-binding CsgD family transcriptional regulator